MAATDSWKGKNILKVREHKEPQVIDAPEADELRKEIEPWLTALVQSEHLSILLGSGVSSAIHRLATGSAGAGMSEIDFSVFDEQIKIKSQESAKKSGRGTPNIEDQIRTASELIKGLEIYVASNVYGSGKISKEVRKLKEELKSGIRKFANAVLDSERKIISTKKTEPAEYLMSFLMSFASRSATRERLNIFTTNYDRVIEHGAELAGIHLIDRFVGSIYPIFRSSRLEIDMHYNPPGIRGEPRYLEGVAYYTKLHGSLDWISDDKYVRRIALPYGAKDVSTYTEEADALMIYPNSSKDRETAEYPYVELFRDLAVAACRPNSTMVLYGYGFGDEHINRVLEDMLTIPSTHLVIIGFSDPGDRIKTFYERAKRPAQMSILVGSHFGDINILVDSYLPKPAIDRTTFRMAELLKARGILHNESSKDETKKDD